MSEIFLVAFAPKIKLQPIVSGDRSFFFYPGLLVTKSSWLYIQILSPDWSRISNICQEVKNWWSEKLWVRRNEKNIRAKCKHFKKKDRVKRMKCKERLLDLIINDHPEIHFQSWGRRQNTGAWVYGLWRIRGCDWRGVCGSVAVKAKRELAKSVKGSSRVRPGFRTSVGKVVVSSGYNKYRLRKQTFWVPISIPLCCGCVIWTTYLNSLVSISFSI